MTADRMARRAGARLVTRDPAAPDAAATLADCRTALAAARGRDLDDICPVSGMDLSAAGYRTARDAWAVQVARGPLGAHAAAGYRRARDVWAAARPDLSGDWPAAVFAPEAGDAG